MGEENKSKVKDQENLEGAVKESATNNPNLSAGLNGNFIAEPVPFYDKTESEKVIKNNNNAWIVLGRDRPSTPASGYGGMAGTQCASIDLVAGRMSGVEGGPKSGIFASPNFTSDAARIYISQRTDIDENFDLVAGGVGLSKGKSGIGIKADAVRIVARDGIKLVTKTDAKNSQGKPITSTLGIDLIAGNDEAELSGPLQSFEQEGQNFLQPLIKGENLVAALDELATQLDDLRQRFDEFVNIQSDYNTAVSMHTHPLFPPPAAIVSQPPYFDLPAPTISFLVKRFVNISSFAWPATQNISTWKTNYLQPTGDRWICSRFNRTT